MTLVILLFHVDKLTSVCSQSCPVFPQIETLCVMDCVHWVLDAEGPVVLTAPPGGRSRLSGEFEGLAGLILMVLQGWDLFTDFLKELLNIDSISGTSLDENSCDGFSKLLRFLHRNFPDVS